MRKVKNHELGPLGESKSNILLLISSSCLSPGQVKKLQKFINFFLNVGHSANNYETCKVHVKTTSSHGSYKIITSKALGTMHTQHFFIRGLFGNARSVTIVVLLLGTFA